MKSENPTILKQRCLVLLVSYFDLFRKKKLTPNRTPLKELRNTWLIALDWLKIFHTFKKWLRDQCLPYFLNVSRFSSCLTSTIELKITSADYVAFDVKPFSLLKSNFPKLCESNRFVYTSTVECRITIAPFYQSSRLRFLGSSEVKDIQRTFKSKDSFVVYFQFRAFFLEILALYTSSSSCAIFAINLTSTVVPCSHFFPAIRRLYLRLVIKRSLNE